MNILQITPRIPFPPTDGGAIGIYNITKQLSLRGHSVTMLALSVNPPNSIPDELSKYCKLHYIKADTRIKKINAFFSLFRKLPYIVSKYQKKEYYKAINELCKKSKFDIVHIDHLAMAPYGIYIKNKYGIPIVLREHNFETKFAERYFSSEKNPIIKFLGMYEKWRIRRFESIACELFDACAAITDIDRNGIRQISPNANVITIPAGTDIPEKLPTKEPRPFSILFFGSFIWKPNIDGFGWFYNNVFPKILEREPKAVLTIAGKGDPSIFSFLRNDSARFLGFVESVSDLYADHEICIIPLFTGSGIRIKILEMFAHKKAIVSTSMGIEGIPAENNSEILIADSVSDFTNSALALMRDAKLRSNIENQARQFVEKYYSWEIIGSQFEELYKSLISAK